MSQFEYLRERDRNADNLFYTPNTPEETAAMESAAKKQAEILAAQRAAEALQSTARLAVARAAAQIQAGQVPVMMMMPPRHVSRSPSPSFYLAQNIHYYNAVGSNGHTNNITNTGLPNSSYNPTTNSNNNINITTSNASTNASAKVALTRPKVKRVEIYRGPPDDVLAGGWPEGWTKVIMQRQGGATKGSKDKYWHSPKGHKFSSKVQVQKFLKALVQTQGNETAAITFYKHIELHPQIVRPAT